jgi:hypothetical protein
MTPTADGTSWPLVVLMSTSKLPTVKMSKIIKMSNSSDNFGDFDYRKVVSG